MSISRKRTVIPQTKELNCRSHSQMSKRKQGILKHIAELIIQNRSLTVENEKLSRQNELLSHEIQKYKNLLAKVNVSELSDKNIPVKKNSLIRFKTATVLYADALGFEHLNPEADSKMLVDSLDEIFLQLQEIIAKYEIQNIRTIGDSLMCIGGIPKKNITNPVEVLLAAVEMQYILKELQRTNEPGQMWKLKIGIHTGTVLADISNRKKSQYDVKGETVNLAARISQICDVGEILISATTFELVKDLFTCECVSKLPVKYQGDMPLFVVRGIRPEFSLQGKGIIPNKQFIIRFGLIQFTDLQEIILDKLEKDLPRNLYYHNVKHTVDVVTQVELIGLGEGVSDEELLLLKTAALFHDTGHTISYDNHEYFSCLVAREILPMYYFTQAQIDMICDLILATKLPPIPKNRLEEIMCDADLDYLGRSDMIPVSNTLFLELKERSMIKSIKEWNRLQMKFISGHQYFTVTARNLREVNKQLQIERIKNLMTED